MELGVRGLTAIAYDAAGGQLLRWHRSGPPAEAGPAKAITALAALARRTIAAVHSSGRDVLGLTVGVPGLVDHDGKVVVAAGLGWRDVELRKDLLRALGRPGFPVLVDNDANLAALAEHRYGPHAGSADLIHLTGDTGVGAGVICDGRLLRGHLGYVGEIGHLRVIPDGPLCGCGRRGCLEAVAALPAILARLDPAGTDADPQVATDQLVRRAEAGESAVLEVLSEAAGLLGRGVSALTNVLNPELIVLGGSYAALGRWLLPVIEKELADGALAPEAGGCQVVASTFDHDATAIGAVARSLDSLDSGRLPVVSASRS
jgi:predicted NBD/HSP70 family sugar kinase